MTTLLDQLHGPKMELVAMKALQDRVAALRQSRFYETAIDEIITAHEQEQLNPQFLAEIVERAQKELRNGRSIAREYLNNIVQRVERRALQQGRKFPLLMIDPLDEKIRAIGRKHLGMFLASYASGKGLALLHLAVAYALQGWNVLFLTLEDPIDTVEDRLDAALTGLPLNRLALLPIKFQNRFKRARKLLRGRIKLIDGTDGGWTVTAIEQAWEDERRNGFSADVIIVDYDDEIECEKKFKGETARRFEFAEIYKRLRRLAARCDVIVWTASQATRKAEGAKILTGAHVAEDLSKVRKVFLAIGIGSDPDNEKVKHLYVLRHRLDRGRFGVDIVSDYDSGVFYDREATMRYREEQRQKEVRQ